jgi:hypothetical protein
MEALAVAADLASASSLHDFKEVVTFEQVAE